MKNLRNSDFIAKLKAQNTQHIELAKELAELGATELNQKMNSSMWSANECIEHLNRYFDYYLPEIKQRIENSRTEKSTLKFKSGWLGNYFA
ncbi:MAG: DinB family protein, partial [Bacteroidia bacterium]